MAAFRLLQPAPMDQERSPQPQTRPLTQKPKRTVTLGACVACRKRKSKCDGLRPTCRCCALKETDCVYEMGPHEKPSQAMKRKNEEMQGELSNLRELYDYLRFRPEHEAQEILRRIRQTDPHTSPRQHVQQLADTVRNGGLSAQNQQSPKAREQRESVMLPSIRAALQSVDFGSPSSASTPRFPHSILWRDLENPISQKRRYVSTGDVSARVAGNADALSHKTVETISEHMSTSQPSDPRLRSAINWTNITDDAEFVVHLLSQWHRWEYRYYHFLDWDLFLEHMASGKRDFCSELLVNALLASASFHSPLVKDRSKPFGANFITYFYSEARRQWDLEDGHNSLPRLQAAMILFMVLGKLGRDIDGYHFLEEACRMARELGLADSEYPATPCPVNVSEEDWSRARAVTAWSLFSFQMLLSYTYPIRVLLTSPPQMLIPDDCTDYEEVLFRSECARQVIMLDVSKTLSELETEPETLPSSFERADKLYLRLQSWWNERLPALDPTEDTSPENLLCAMNYHTSKISLVRPFLRHNATTKELPTPHPSRFQSIYTTSLKSLRRLLTLQEDHHGWHNTIPYILHPIVITSFGCLDEIATDKPSHFSLEMHESYLGLLTCLRALNAIAGFIYYAQPLFRLLAQACQALDVRLPRETADAVERYRSEEWTKEARSLVSSTYVADTRDAVEDLETRRMDAVIAQWEAFTLGKGKGRDLSAEEGQDWKRQGRDGSIAHEAIGEGLPLRSG